MFIYFVTGTENRLILANSMISVISSSVLPPKDIVKIRGDSAHKALEVLFCSYLVLL